MKELHDRKARYSENEAKRSRFAQTETRAGFSRTDSVKKEKMKEDTDMFKFADETYHSRMENHSVRHHSARLDLASRRADSI